MVGTTTGGESATTEVSSSALPVQHQPVVRPHLKSAGARPCGRLAPSPTGALHLGNIRTFMVAWLQMRACGGEVRLRIEDLDHPKHKAGAADALIEDLRWLGFDWDGPIVRQSDRLPIYKEALERLAPLYPCFCSRADIQGAQSAPHPGEVLRYPGTCRRRVGPAPEGRIPAWRLPLGPEDDGRYVDAFAGPQTKTADALTGDFVLARGEDPAYVLAVVVDDHEMGITDIVRGDDILPVTPAQNVLYRRLGWTPPTYWHIPLVVGPDGLRLAKRHGDTRVSAYRAAGITSGRILSALARTCGWIASSESVASLADLIPRFSSDTIPHTPLVWHDSLL